MTNSVSAAQSAAPPTSRSGVGAGHTFRDNEDTRVNSLDLRIYGLGFRIQGVWLRV
jgi:hypothetical protein